MGVDLRVQCTLYSGSIFDLKWWVSNLNALKVKDFPLESLILRFFSCIHVRQECTFLWRRYKRALENGTES